MTSKKYKNEILPLVPLEMPFIPIFGCSQNLNFQSFDRRPLVKGELVQLVACRSFQGPSVTDFFSSLFCRRESFKMKFFTVSKAGLVEVSQMTPDSLFFWGKEGMGNN